jgi:hypothetical protein
MENFRKINFPFLAQWVPAAAVTPIKKSLKKFLSQLKIKSL